MSFSQLPDLDFLNNRLYYDPDTGIFRWREAGPEFFKTHQSRNLWNGRYAGTKAGNVSYDGYERIGFRGKIPLAHRLAWLMQTGSWPESFLDHIDGDKTNNRMNNLREVCASQNQRNCPKRKDNKTGTIGVSWNKSSRKWAANIKADGKQKHLGYFEDINDAIKARKEAERRHGYHENHGR